MLYMATKYYATSINVSSPFRRERDTWEDKSPGSCTLVVTSAGYKQHTNIMAFIWVSLHEMSFLYDIVSTSWSESE